MGELAGWYFVKYSRSIFKPLSRVDRVLVVFHGALRCTREYVSRLYSTNTLSVFCTSAGNGR